MATSPNAFECSSRVAPAQAAEEVVQVGSQSADDKGSGSICIQVDSNAGFAGLKKIVADNVRLSNGAQVNDV